MLKYLYKERYRILFISILYALLASFAIVPFDFFGSIIDGITNKTMDFHAVLIKSMTMVGIALAFYVFQCFGEIAIFKGFYKYAHFLQREILEKVITQTPKFFDQMSIGEIMGRMTQDAGEHIPNLFGWGFYAYAKGVVETTVIFFYIVHKIDIKFALLINIPYMIITIMILLLKKPIQKGYDKMGADFDNISKKTLESIKGVRIVRAYNLLPNVKKEYFENLDSYSKSNLKYSMYQSYTHSLNVIAVALSYFFLILYGYYSYSQGDISFGTLVGTSLVLGMLPWPYTMLSAFIITFFEAQIGIKRVNDVLDASDVIEKSGDKALHFQDKIEFKNFSFSYGDNEVLKNLSFSLKKGETLGIIGKTGSGKTTLIKQFLRLYPANSGIYVDDVEISDYDVTSLRSNFGYCPQEYFIFSQTIAENVLFNRDLEDQLETALEIADLKKDIESFSDGVNTLVGENGISLSGGQKQRLSIARAIISNPEILIFDDSLSALDTNTEKNIIENLSKIRQGKTNIIVSHRISSIIHADNILILNEGTIEAQGSHAQLLEKSKWYLELFQYQSKNEQA